VDIERDHCREKPGEDQGEVFLISALASLLSVIAFFWFFSRGDILLYGDAVAHLNIARHLTDARDAGWRQIGSVWLPLPHLLAAPFVANDWLWRTGIGGAIPSMAGYVLGVGGIYRLVRARGSAAGASLAAAIYGLNPSLLYMQSTAMTESIFLAAMVWAVVYFDDFLRGLQADSAGEIPARADNAALSAAGARADNAALPAAGARAGKAIERCGIYLMAAIFIRYDGWIIAFVVGVWASVAALRWLCRRAPQPKIGRAKGKAGLPSAGARLLRSMTSFLLLLALCPALWLAHNYAVNRRPLDWLNGPYSAKAIERRSSRPGDPPYPGKGNAMVAAQYFLKAARMNTGEGGRENWLLGLALGGVLVAAFHLRRFAAFLLLWIPLPFYAYSIGYGSVPIFIPEWWPFSYYNVRYGLEMLPAIAVFAGLIPWAVSEIAAPPCAGARARRALTLGVTCALLVMTLLAYSSSAWCFSLRSQDRDWGRRWMIPICYREAWANSRSRMALEAQVGAALSAIPPNATVLMYTSEYVGALQRAGIHFDHVISESTFTAWDSARSAPFAGADYIVAVAGDPVDEAVRINPRGLTKLEIIHTMGKPDVTIYRGSRP
jgi:hypothetical protein